MIWKDKSEFLTWQWETLGSPLRFLKFIPNHSKMAARLVRQGVTIGIGDGQLWREGMTEILKAFSLRKSGEKRQTEFEQKSGWLTFLEAPLWPERREFKWSNVYLDLGGRDIWGGIGTNINQKFLPPHNSSLMDYGSFDLTVFDGSKFKSGWKK